MKNMEELIEAEQKELYDHFCGLFDKHYQKFFQNMNYGVLKGDKIDGKILYKEPIVSNLEFKQEIEPQKFQTQTLVGTPKSGIMEVVFSYDQIGELVENEIVFLLQMNTFFKKMVEKVNEFHSHSEKDLFVGGKFLDLYSEGNDFIRSDSEGVKISLFTEGCSLKSMEKVDG